MLLSILIALTLCEIVLIKKQKDQIYTGYLLCQVTMPTWSLCAQYCSTVNECKSINFIPLNKTCQINDAFIGYIKKVLKIFSKIIDKHDIK